MNTTRSTTSTAPSAFLIPLGIVALPLLIVFVIVSTLASRSPRVRRSDRTAPTTASVVTTAAEAPVERPRRRFTIKTALGSTAAVLIGVLFAASAASGSYALWNRSAAITDTTVKSGSLSFTVKYGTDAAGATATIPATAWTGMLPGDVVGQQITLTSTGTARSDVTARLAATSAWEIRVATGTCPATQLPSAALTTTAVVFADFAGGLSSSICVQATLPAGAAAAVQGSTAAFQLVLGATQKAS